MAVTLTPMTAKDYEKFYRVSLDSQVSDLMKGGSSREEAVRDTEAELSEMLPAGKDTRDNQLMMIRKEDDLTEVGYIWTLHELTDGIRQSFLCDLMVYEEFRRRGYAKEALELMTRNAHALGVWRASFMSIRITLMLSNSMESADIRLSVMRATACI